MVLVESGFENKLLLPFHADVARVTVLEPKFYFFILCVIALDICLIFRLLLAVLDVLNIVIDHYVFGPLEAHGVIRLVVVNLVLLLRVHTLVFKSQLLRFFRTEHPIAKNGFHVRIFIVSKVYFVLGEEEFFAVL